ncbi:MAG: ThiF family adenylyltransferase [Gemmatimonadaceae bacterium]
MTPPARLQDFIATVTAPDVPPSDSWQPFIFTLHLGEREAFESACAALHLAVVDTFERQLADLAVIRHPRAGTEAQRAAFVAAGVASTADGRLPGNWVYFPWLRQVVRTLEREDYFDLITDRNHDKITADEQRQLRTKTIGVVGLSVGGEAAVTLAQEHLCGHLVVADFDRLDLSNLNRLHSGVDELGVLKTTIVARRIARIDPYLRVTVFPQGVTAKNVDEFLQPLDLLVEECDGLALKYDLRTEARARRLNIIYAADERGFLSVEPYAHALELTEFHGVVTTRPQPRSAYPTASAFMRALVAWVGGWEGISQRSRASLEQIGESRSGYPQLAGEARFAAGQLAHVARRLLLGERLAPYLGQMDLDDILR